MMDNVLSNVDFEAETMKRLVKTDRLLKFTFDDLMRRNPKSDESYILEVVFNSYVIDDSVMMDEYLSLR